MKNKDIANTTDNTLRAPKTVPSGHSNKANIKESTEWPPALGWLN